MKIEVWSDYVCPFCYLGKRQLELAIENFPYKDNIVIEYKSFELNPTQKNTPDKKYNDPLVETKTYNLPVEEIKKMARRIKKEADEIGLTYKTDRLTQANTFDAHRLVKYAGKQNKDSEMIEFLLKAYFTQSEQIDDHDILLDIGRQCGLNQDEIIFILSNNTYAQSVKCDQLEAEEIGIENVPFFLFNEKHAVPGIQSTQYFTEVLEAVWQEMNGYPKFSLKKGKKHTTTYCSNNDCT